MIIYWDTLEKNATDPAVIPAYIASPYFLPGILKDEAYLASNSALFGATQKAIKDYFDAFRGGSEFLSVFLSATQSNIANATFTKVEFDSVDFDTGDNYDNETNFRYTVPSAGMYFISADLHWIDVVASKRFATEIRKNGARYKFESYNSSFADAVTSHADAVMSLAADDYIEIFAYHDSGVDTPDLYGYGSIRFSSLCIYKLN